MVLVWIADGRLHGSFIANRKRANLWRTRANHTRGSTETMVRELAIIPNSSCPAFFRACPCSCPRLYPCSWRRTRATKGLQTRYLCSSHDHGKDSVDTILSDGFCSFRKIPENIVTLLVNVVLTEQFPTTNSILDCPSH